MPTASESIDAAIREVTTARSLVLKINSKQIAGVDAVGSLKATALAWFNTHRPIVVAAQSDLDLSSADEHYTTILNSTARHAARQTYLDSLQELKKVLVQMLPTALTAPAPSDGTDDLAPDFSPLAGNQEMRDILTRRWQECCKS